MAITLVGTGGVSAAASGNLTGLTLPAGLNTDDFMLLILSQHDNVVSTVSGWTQFNATNVGTALRGALFYKRYVAGDSAPTVTHASGDAIIGRIIAFNGVTTSATPPWNATQGTGWNTSNSSTNGTTRTVTGVTTAVANTMIVYIGADGQEGTHASYTGTDPSGATLLANEQIDNGTTLGLDCGIWGTYGAKATAGATGSIGCTASISSTYLGYVLALEPAPARIPRISLLGVG